nr:MAG TPA: hypothetical protein [Caudoviricetes sp.]
MSIVLFLFSTFIIDFFPLKSYDKNIDTYRKEV